MECKLTYEDYVWERTTPRVKTEEALNNFSIIDMERSWAVLGLVAEAGEVAAEIEKGIRKGDLVDRDDKIFDECSDVLFFLTAILNSTGHTLEELMVHNMKKLDARTGTTLYKGGEIPVHVE